MARRPGIQPVVTPERPHGRVAGPADVRHAHSTSQTGAAPFGSAGVRAACAELGTPTAPGGGANLGERPLAGLAARTDDTPDVDAASYWTRAVGRRDTLIGKLRDVNHHMLADLDTVAEVRTGLGAVTAVQLADPATAPATVVKLREHGVSTRAAGQGALQISPAFVMTTAEVGELADRMRAALS